jgi:hypothetical protein
VLPKLNSVAWVRERNIHDRAAAVCRVSTFADRGCRVVRVTDPYGRILDFLDRSRYFVFQIAAQLYSRRWVDPVDKSNNNEPKQILTSAGLVYVKCWLIYFELP